MAADTLVVHLQPICCTAGVLRPRMAALSRLTAAYLLYSRRAADSYGAAAVGWTSEYVMTSSLRPLGMTCKDAHVVRRGLLGNTRARSV